jgi:hypothetical protein
VSHMVIFRASDGKPGYHQTEGLEESVRFVERLRNSENVEQARIFHMEEVSFNFKPYYKVELGDEARDTPDAAPTRERAREHSPVALVAVAEQADAPEDEVVDSAISMAAFSDEDVAGANGRRGLFGR